MQPSVAADLLLLMEDLILQVFPDEDERALGLHAGVLLQGGDHQHLAAGSVVTGAWAGNRHSFNTIFYVYLREIRSLNI